MTLQILAALQALALQIVSHLPQARMRQCVIQFKKPALALRQASLYTRRSLQLLK